MIAKMLYLFGLVSIIASVYIYNFTDPLFGMYIGLWAPTFLVMATYDRLRESMQPVTIDTPIHPKWDRKG